MSQLFEADVALLHIAGGAARITPPPGTLAQTSPRRAARGRSEDYLLLNLALRTSRHATPAMVDHLSQLSARAYYGTPGSVTSAIREAAAIVNDRLIDANQSEDSPTQFQGNWLCAVLRGKDLYIGQAGRGQAILIRPGTVTRFTSQEAAERPLGVSITPHIRYHHLEIKAGDLLVLSTTSSEIWSDATLSGLATLNLDQAIDRLVAASGQDLTGLLARIVHEGQAGMQPAFSSDPSEAEAMSARRPPQTARRRTTRIESLTSGLSEVTDQILKSVRQVLYKGLEYISAFLSRVAPGITEPLHPDALSRRILAVTAVIVPLVVVLIAALIYNNRGRSEQFQNYLDQAYASVASAQLKASPEEARGDWQNAMRSLNLAEQYDQNDQSRTLREQVQASLDALNLVVRLDFQPVVSGGFGSEAEITSIAASTTDLYVLDARNQIVRHAWGSPERGFEIDSAFDCLGTGVTFQNMGEPIDIVIQEAPGALGAEGIVAIDADGTLVYCAPDRQPALAELTAPDLGWGRIQAIDVYGGALYVLDPVVNAVWIYEATGGFFSGTPELYFVEEVRDLRGAIDLALAQDELVLLYADGRLDRCRRFRGSESETGEQSRIRVECDPQPTFQDDRPGYGSTVQIPGAVAAEMSYSAPPEPSLFFLDVLNNSVFHYSMRLVYQAQYIPLEPFDEELSAMTLGPPNDLYVSAGSQVYHARP
ncbi:MAG: hypothetical protein PVH92_04180 [Anaerolineales bacterium]|jgi:hypothetical protein